MSLESALVSDIKTAGRSRVYALLAEAFSFPQGAAVLRLLDGDLLAELKEAFEQTGYVVEFPDELTMPPTKNAIQELQVIYTELFDVTSGTPKVSLLERRYCDTPEQELWQKVLRFYSHFGLDFSEGGGEEQPDHLLTELGFMHYLSFLEAGSPSVSDTESFQRGQRDFLRLHIGTWAESLVEKLAEPDMIHPYLQLGRLLENLARNDLEHLEECVPTQNKDEEVQH